MQVAILNFPSTTAAHPYDPESKNCTRARRIYRPVRSANRPCLRYNPFRLSVVANNVSEIPRDIVSR